MTDKQFDKATEGITIDLVKSLKGGQMLQHNDDYYLYSYETRVAEIDHKNRTITPLDWYSVTTSKHINYVGSEYGYEVQKVK